jgi:hypothetical protein
MTPETSGATPHQRPEGYHRPQKQQLAQKPTRRPRTRRSVIRGRGVGEFVRISRNRYRNCRLISNCGKSSAIVSHARDVTVIARGAIRWGVSVWRRRACRRWTKRNRIGAFPQALGSSCRRRGRGARRNGRRADGQPSRRGRNHRRQALARNATAPATSVPTRPWTLDDGACRNGIPSDRFRPVVSLNHLLRQLRLMPA